MSGIIETGRSTETIASPPAGTGDAAPWRALDDATRDAWAGRGPFRFALEGEADPRGHRIVGPTFTTGAEASLFCAWANCVAAAMVPPRAALDGTPYHRGKPILGPQRCLCDEPGPIVRVDAGMWGTLACATCCRLLLSHRQPSAPTAGVRETVAAIRDKLWRHRRRLHEDGYAHRSLHLDDVSELLVTLESSALPPAGRREGEDTHVARVVEASAFRSVTEPPHRPVA